MRTGRRVTTLMSRLGPMAAFLFGCLVWSGSAQADLITYNFTGTVTNVSQPSPFGLTAAPGNTITGLFIYDTTTGDGSPGDPNFGSYNQSISLGFLFTLNGVNITTSSYDVLVTNDSPPGITFDELEIFSSSGILVAGIPQPSANMSLQLRDATGGVFTGDGLPPWTLTLADFTTATGSLVDTSTGATIDFMLTNLTGIPAPGPIGLLGVALLGLSLGRRRRICR